VITRRPLVIRFPGERITYVGRTETERKLYRYRVTGLAVSSYRLDLENNEGGRNGFQKTQAPQLVEKVAQGTKYENGAEVRVAA
jgi:hypothetical protein